MCCTRSGYAAKLTLPHGVGSRSQPVIFDFHSGFWINLHHFIYQQALLRKHDYKGSENAHDTVSFNALNDAERKNWGVAIHQYQITIVNQNLLDSAMALVKNLLEEHENEPSLSGIGLPTPLEAILNSISDSYRTHFWPSQNKNNLAWIKRMTSMVHDFGGNLRDELAQVYATPWPGQAIRVDVTNYASWAGAYTTLSPVRITISSVDVNNQDVSGFEILFHESSHALVDKIRVTINEIVRQDQKLLPRRDLWHAVLFYTTGEIVRRHFADYTPYAQHVGLWDKAWPTYIRLLEKDWRPYMEGKDRFDDALHKLVTDAETVK